MSKAEADYISPKTKYNLRRKMQTAILQTETQEGVFLLELVCKEAHYEWTQEHTSAALARLEDVLVEEDGRILTAQESGFFCKD